MAAVALTFDDFYLAKRSELVRALTAHLGDQLLAAEAVDEGMARAYENWTEVARLANPAGWVYRSALNWATSRLRRAQTAIRKMHLIPRTTAHHQPVVDHALQDALQALGVKHRNILIARYLLDWSVEETADALKISAGTVKSRSSRALAQLKNLLEEDQNEPQP